MKDKPESKIVDINNARSEEQIAALKKIREGNFCPFCRREYLEKEHKKPILLETDEWLATENRWPYEGTKTHLLLIHKKHITHVNELSSKAWTDLHEIIKKLTEKILGGTLLMRFGSTANTGATVEHLHAHLVSGDPDYKKPILARVG